MESSVVAHMGAGWGALVAVAVTVAVAKAAKKAMPRSFVVEGYFMVALYAGTMPL